MSTSTSLYPSNKSIYSNNRSKKKPLPISINSNQNPMQFLFNNPVSKIATSYKDIGEKIQNIEKQKKCSRKLQTTTSPGINNFLSMNGKVSTLSNGSILSKNTSNIITSRILPAKNLSTSIYNKNTYYIHKMQKRKDSGPKPVTNRIFAIGNSINNSKVSRQKSFGEVYESNLRKKNSIRTISTHSKNLKTSTNDSLLPSSVSKIKISRIARITKSKEKGLINDYLKCKKKIKKFNKVSSSHGTKIIKKPSTIITNSISEPNQNKSTFLTTHNNTITNGNHQGTSVEMPRHSLTKRNQRGFSYDSIMHQDQRKKNDSQHKNNHSININRLALNNFIKANNIEKKESEEKKSTKREHIPIGNKVKINLGPVLRNIKVNKKDTRNKNSSSDTNHQRSLSKQNDTSKNIKLEEADEEACERLLSDNCSATGFNHNNLFEDDDFLSENKTEDPFDDLNEIVRKIHFSLMPLCEENLFSIEDNKKYDQYEKVFNSQFEKFVSNNIHKSGVKSNSKTNTKSTDRKSVHNISLSTQENSYKKYFSSPIHSNKYS